MTQWTWKSGLHKLPEQLCFFFMCVSKLLSEFLGLRSRCTVPILGKSVLSKHCITNWAVSAQYLIYNSCKNAQYIIMLICFIWTTTHFNPSTDFFALSMPKIHHMLTKSQDEYQAIYPFRFAIHLPILTTICKQNKYFNGKSRKPFC